MAEPNPAAPVRVIEEMPGYWRVVFDYPPFNIVDADVFQALQDLLVRMDTTRACASLFSRVQFPTSTWRTLI